MITKEQYEKAKLIINEYQQQLKVEYDKKLVLIKADLIEYFKNNKVCGMTIFDFNLSSPWWNNRDYICNVFFIYAIDPFFDEDYDDDKADDDIEEIGKKYGINLSWDISVYSK